MKQVQAAEVSQPRTAVSSKCFQLYYTCSDRLLAIAFPRCSFHLFFPPTVMFPKLSVILRPLYLQYLPILMCVVLCARRKSPQDRWQEHHATLYLENISPLLKILKAHHIGDLMWVYVCETRIVFSKSIVSRPRWYSD
jgi:hypothetical protein